MTRIVFMDTETTGLSLNDDIWEFACIIREPGQEDVEIQTFVRHDEEKAKQLPGPFFADYYERYSDELAIPQVELARLVLDLTGGKSHIVGAVPNFDTERLSIVLRRHGYIPAWHYHLIDVENLAVGFLAGRYSGPDARVDLPWDSDVLSARLGVTAPVEDRHTAMGDCRWARDIFDAVMADTNSYRPHLAVS